MKSKIFNTELGLDQLVSIPFDVIRQYKKPFLKLLSIILVVQLLPSLIISLFSLFFQSGSSAIDFANPLWIVISILVGVAFNVLFFIVYVYFDATSIAFSNSALKGENIPSVSAAFKKAKNRVLPALGTALLQGLIYLLVSLPFILVVGFILFYIIGIGSNGTEITEVTALVMLVLLCCLFILVIPLYLTITTQLFFVQTSTVLRPVAGIQALSYARKLVKGRFFKAMAFIFVLGLVSTIFSFIMSFILSIVVSFFDIFLGFLPGLATLLLLFQTVISSLVGAAIQVYWSVFRTAWFLNLEYQDSEIEVD